MDDETTTRTGMDMTELLAGQHREVERLWSALEASHRSGATDQGDIARRLVTLLSQHDAMETQLLYPELRSAGGKEGEDLSGHSLDEHKRVRGLLKAVDGEDPRDEVVFDTWSQCISAVRHHVEEEEGDIFPLLRQHCDGDRLRQLGERMEMMQEAAPTHPHPHTPDSKLGAMAAGAVAGAVDHVRDALHGEGSDEERRH